MVLKDKHIFLLEDDPTNFAVMRTLLRAHGATAVLDHWGDTTLKNLKNYPFDIDLIILDLMLPGNVTGYDIFDLIQADEAFQDIPVVIVSAADPDIEIPKAQVKGINGFISKPINRHKFPQQLLTIIDGGAVWNDID